MQKQHGRIRLNVDGEEKERRREGGGETTQSGPVEPYASDTQAPNKTNNRTLYILCTRNIVKALVMLNGTNHSQININRLAVKPDTK